MKLLNPKPLTLSPAQSQLWDAVSECKHTVTYIAKRSGVPAPTIRRWLAGLHEPIPFNLEAVLEAIELLKDEPVKQRFDWPSNVLQLKTLVNKGMSTTEISKVMGVNRCCVNYAKHRYLKAA